MSTDAHTQTRVQTKTVEGVGFLSPPATNFKSKYEEREYIKGRLAAAFRIFARFNLNEGAAGHITARDPIEADTFLNKPASTIHGAIHAARSDVICAAHTHSVYGRAICALGKPLDMLTLEACMFYKSFRQDYYIYDGKGVVLEGEEAAQIAKALGDKKAAILKNHRLLTTGATIEETVHWFTH
ncbi:Class II Aldolase family [Fusarium phyllophilum]|uniref:Class II Aldolase family n=1 Tax=Fusarium phyllophilum TaxID=47803 RepID=A0A8H5N9J8_9HYPO|nr:Class II Aldolase family [Fusarium phyllophilum]